MIHDLDKAGFEISQRLTTVSEWAEENDRVLYQFKNQIDVTDLGLRLSDVEKYGLASETCNFKGDFARDSICTEAEKEFLRSGRRVELNAFTSPQFIEWLESMLTEHGLAKPLIPDDATLEAAYRRAVVLARINKAIDEVLDEATNEADEMAVPKTLKRQLQKTMKETSESWDKALYHQTKSKLYPDADQ